MAASRSEFDRGRIVGYREQGLSFEEIAARIGITPQAATEV
jgi:hypothetical protein